MKRQGVQKAKADLREAKKALDQLKHARTLNQVDEAWITFIEKLARFFNKLRASAKGDAQSEGWISKITNERSSDETLNYLIQARNATEHTIEDITEKVPGHFSIGGGSIYIENLEVGPAGIKGKIHGSPDTVIVTEQPKVRLLPVTNRGITYQVPQIHLGIKIKATPILLASLATTYAEKILADAEQRVKL